MNVLYCIKQHTRHINGCINEHFKNNYFAINSLSFSGVHLYVY